MVEEADKPAIAADRDRSESSMKKSNAVNEGDLQGKEPVIDSNKAAAKMVAPPPKRHPLENAWTFWFDNPSVKSRQAAWGSSIRPVYTFSSVEDFWRVYNNIHHPSKLAVGADFHCFKRLCITTSWQNSFLADVEAETKEKRKAENEETLCNHRKTELAENNEKQK